MVCAGDVVNGSPDSRACWELVASLQLPLVRGNHERYLFDLYGEQARPEWHGQRFGPVQWSWRQFLGDELEQMRSLPLCLRLPEAPDLLIVHASPRADRDAVLLPAALRRFRESDYLAEAGPMARLLQRELETARFQMMPFLDQYERWSREWPATAFAGGRPLPGSPTLDR